MNEVICSTQRSYEITDTEENWNENMSILLPIDVPNDGLPLCASSSII